MTRAHFAFAALALLSSSVLARPTIDLVPRDSPELDLAGSAAQLAKREPHLPQLIEPKQGDILKTGDYYDFDFTDGETTASAVRLVLRNSTSSVTVFPASVPFVSFRASGYIRIPHAAHLAPGAYQLFVKENTYDVPDKYDDDAAWIDVTVQQGHPPKPTKRDLAEREPHPPHILDPASGTTVTAGTPFYVRYTDGETTASQTKVVLRAADGSETVLSSGPFEDFGYQANVTVPTDLSSGDYELVFQENTEDDPETFSDAVSEPITVQSSS